MKDDNNILNKFIIIMFNSGNIIYFHPNPNKLKYKYISVLVL